MLIKVATASARTLLLPVRPKLETGHVAGNTDQGFSPECDVLGLRRHDALRYRLGRVDRVAAGRRKAELPNVY